MIFYRLFFGILVTAYLPGMLIVKRLGFQIPFFSRVLISSFLSLILIFQVSFIATLSHALWIYWAYFFSVLGLTLYSLRVVSFASVIEEWNLTWLSIQKNKVQLSFFLLMIVFISARFDRFNNVFTNWDAIVSWGRWANDWYNGIFPQGTYHYAQLLPASWAAIYRYAGHDYQFFVVFLVPTLVMTFLFSLVEGIKDLRGASALGFILIFYWINHLFDIYLFDGYVDIIVMISAGCALVSLNRAYLSEGEKRYSDADRYMLAALLSASASALTKQGGLLVMAYVLIESVILNRKIPSEKNRNFRNFSLVLILVLPFYAYIEYLIRKGVIGSEVSWVTRDIYQGKSPLQRLIDATLSMRITSYLFLANFIWAIVFNGWKRRLAVFTFTLYVIWGCFFSYDYRNLSVGYAANAFTYGVLFGDRFFLTLNSFQNWLKRKNYTKLSVLWVFIPLAVILFLANRNNSNERLELHNRKLKIQAYTDAVLAYFLYSGWNQKCVEVHSNWALLSYLPDFSEKYQWINLRDIDDSNLRDFELVLGKSGFHCYVIPVRISQRLEDVLQKSIAAGVLYLKYQSDEHRYFQIVEK